jgi:hypothetical protein
MRRRHPVDFGFSPTTAPCRKVRERLIDELDPLHRNEIHGCTDSEHVFRYLTTLWEREPERPLLEIMRVSLERVIDWCREIDLNRRISLNVRWTDTSGQKIGYVTDAGRHPRQSTGDH